MVESIFEHPQSNVYRKRLKFYSNTAQVFRLLHGIQSTGTITVKQLRLLDSSSSLVSFVNVYTSLLHDYYDDIKYDKGVEANQERLSYQKVTVVWTLLQILFFSELKPNSNFCYGTKLINWMNYFDKRGLLQFDAQGVFNSDIPTNHTSFWPMVYMLILRGKLDTLQQLLDVASQRVPDPYDKTILGTLTKLIHSFPKLESTNDNNNNVDSVVDGDVEQHISAKRKTWRQHATHDLRKLDPFRTARPTLVTHTKASIDMLSGNITTLCQKASSSIEAIVASIYYYNNDNNTIDSYSYKPVTIRTINKVAEQVIEIRNSESTSTTTTNQLDQHMGLLALLKGNIYQAMEQCAELDWWLLAHMSDILDRYTLQRQQDGLNDHNMDDDGGSIGIFGGEPLYLHIGGRQQAAEMESRVFFLLTYANSLVVQEGMWHTAFDYMGTCGILGRSEISKTIDKIPMSNDNVALEVADYCTRNGLLDQRQRIYEKRAAQLDQQQCYSEAVRYYCLAGKFEQLEEVFRSILHRYCENRKLEAFEELDPLYKVKCDGPQAKFYFGFYDMQMLYKEGKITEARNLAIDLMLSVGSPDYFLPVLFLESIALLEQGQDALSSEVVTQLDQRLRSVMALENKDGLRLLKTYLRENLGNDDDYVTSLLDMCEFIIDRLSQ